MCLLIHQPKGVTFSKRDLKDYLSHNQDGFGIAYPQDGKLNVVKVVGDDAMAIGAYYAVAAGRPAMLHFRMATHGDRTAKNCHPFLLTPEIAVAHNGILDIDANVEDGFSDTYLFAEHILKPMALADRDALFRPAVRDLLAGIIGQSNRLMFMRADGKVSIVNEDAGVYHKRAWLSNTYAWSAPGNEKWRKWAGYGGGYEYEQPTGRVIGSSRNVVHLISDGKGTGGIVSATGEKIDHAGHALTPSVPDDAPELPDRLMNVLEDLSVAWYGLGADGVREWLTTHPDEAVDLTCEWYQITPEQGLQCVLSNPQLMTQWLVDIVTDDPAFT